MRRGLSAALVALAAAGCGGDAGKVKGRVVENGQPLQIPAQAAIMFTLVGPDDKPDPSRSYTMNIGPDGTFELLASGGQLPPGKYMVTVETTAPKAPTGFGKYKETYRYPTSTLRQEVKAGQNEIVIDLAKPNG
jgi:hypothetical protein